MQKYGVGVAIGFVLFALYAKQFVFNTYVEIDLETYINYKAPVQIYWAAKDEPFSERRVQTRWIYSKHNIIRIRTGDLSDGGRLRIDPIRYKGHAKIRSVYIDRSGYKPVWLKSEETLSTLKPVNDIASAVYEDEGLVITTTGGDSQLELDLDLEKLPGISWHHVVNFLLIMAASILVAPVIARGFQSLSYVPVCLFTVFVLAWTMSVVSRPAYHPDEVTHLNSIRYYQNYVLPPAVDAPEMVYTYSEYGNSRLNGNEIYYPLAGFFARLTDTFKQPLVVSSRAFSLLMLALIVLLVIRSESLRMIATPLLVTPQVWYQYSYANSDMFAITVCLLVGWMAVDRNSALNRFLIDPAPKRYVGKTLLLGLALGSLLFLKINYYAFALFIALYYFWRLWMGEFERPTQTLLRGGLITLVGLTLFGAKFVYDGVINDWDRASRVHAMWETYADPEYKPSTPMTERHPEMYLRERGDTLIDMFEKHRWGGKSFVTSFGGYGFTRFFASPTYFEWLRWLALITVGTLVGFYLWRAPGKEKVLALITVFMVTTVLAISLYLSWVRILQPQGRYLAVILPMLGVFYAHARPWMPKYLWHFLILAMFVMALYSFVFVGLADIHKVSFNDR